MSVGHFHIPGDATRREYAVYIMVATHRVTCERKLYVGKTGDNRDGCNPVISRAGNHLSFNPVHSQMRNYLLPDNPHDYDFDYFYATFGTYLGSEESRDGIDTINEMERRLNVLAQTAFGSILNPLKGTGWMTQTQRSQRASLATQVRLEQLAELVRQVQVFLALERSPTRPTASCPIAVLPGQEAVGLVGELPGGSSGERATEPTLDDPGTACGSQE